MNRERSDRLTAMNENMNLIFDQTVDVKWNHLQGAEFKNSWSLFTSIVHSTSSPRVTEINKTSNRKFLIQQKLFPCTATMSLRGFACAINSLNISYN